MQSNDTSRTDRPMRVKDAPLTIDPHENSIDASRNGGNILTPPCRDVESRTVDGFPACGDSTLVPAISVRRSTFDPTRDEQMSDTGRELRLKPPEMSSLQPPSTSHTMRSFGAADNTGPPQENVSIMVATSESPSLQPPVASPTESRNSDIAIGVGLVLVASSALLGAAYVFKLVAGKYKASAHELLFIRGLNSIFFSLIGAVAFGVPLFSHSREEVILISWRTVFGTANTILYSVAIIGVPVSLMSVLNCSMPLVVAILARVFISELIFLGDIICIFVGMIGLTMVLKQPAVLFGTFTDASSNFYLCLVLLMIAILTNACFGVISRKMKGRIHYLDVAMHYGVALAVVEACVVYGWGIPFVFSVEKFFVMMGLHTLSYVALFAFHYAHRYLTATSVSFNTFIQAVGSVVIDLLIGVVMDKFSIIGTVVLIVSGIMLTVLKVVRERRAMRSVSP